MAPHDPATPAERPLPPRNEPARDRASGLKRLAWPILLLVSTASIMYYLTARAEVRRKLDLVAATEQRRAGAEQRLTLATEALQRVIPRWYAGDVRQAHHDWQAGRLAAARARLDHRSWPVGEPVPDGFEWRYLKRVTEPVSRLTVQPGAPPITALAAPGGQPFALRAAWGADLRTPPRAGAVVLGPPNETADPTGREAIAWSSPTARSVRLTPDGRRWVALDADGLWHGPTAPPAVTGPVAVAADLQLLAIAPDGARVLAVGVGATAGGVVLDTATGRTLLTLPDRMDVTTAAFGPDGQTLAVCGRPIPPDDADVDAPQAPAQVTLWNLAEGERLATVAPGLDTVRALALTGDPTRLIVAGADGTPERRGLVEVWDPAAGGPALRLAAPDGPVEFLAVRPDGQALATAGTDRLVRLWRLRDDPARFWGGQAGRPLGTFRGLDGDLTALAFGDGGRALYAADSSGEVAVFDATADPEVQVLDELGYAIGTVLFTPDSRTLLAVDYKSVTRFDVETGRKLGAFEVEPWIFAAALRPDGALLALGGETGSGGGKPAVIHLVDPTSGVVKAIIRPGPGTQAVRSLAFSPDGTLLAVTVRADEGFATDDDPADPPPPFEGLQLWDVATLTKRAEWPGPAGSVAFDPTGRRLVSAGAEGRLLVRELKDLAAEPLTIDAGAGSGLFLTPDGMTVIAGAPGRNQIAAWELATGEPRWTIQSASGLVALSPDGQTLALREGSNLVLMQAATGETFFRLGGLHYGASTAAFSPDGSALAAGGGSRDENDGVHLWRAAPAAR